MLILPFAATWMELEILILSEACQKKKDNYHVISLVCGIENMAQMNLSTEQKQIIENRPVLAKGKGVWG